MKPELRILISIILLWLFTISGVIGILTETYRDWFLALTPLNLLLSFGILIWNSRYFKATYVLALSIPFVLGFITEALGVNYGLIFGNYTYGENLGYKFLGVPIMICFNWALLTAVTADISKLMTKNLVLASIIGASLMTLLDMLIEVSAPRFDFWEFENGIVPLQNYLGWLLTAFVAHLGYQYLKVKTNLTISWHILISMAVFFAIFLCF